MAVLDRFFAPDSAFQKNFFFLAKRFVAGKHVNEAIAAVRELNASGMSASLDFLGEDVLDRQSALTTRDAYFEILDAIKQSGADSNVSVKLTALGLLIDEDFAYQNFEAIVQRAQQNPDPFVRIDMEGSAVTDATLRLFERTYAAYPNVGIVLQAYLKRTPGDVARAIELDARVRLCKGAYNEPPSIAIKSMPEIRGQYMRCARDLLTQGNYPGIATHDRRLIAAVKEFVRVNDVARDRFEFQMIYGVRPNLQRELIKEGYRLRVYVPFGTHWAAYFYRRVAERKENLLFALSSIFTR